MYIKEINLKYIKLNKKKRLHFVISLFEGDQFLKWGRQFRVLGAIPYHLKYKRFEVAVKAGFPH